MWNARPESICTQLDQVESIKDASKLVSSISAIEALEEEAEATAQELVSLHQEGQVLWKECALLFRSTTNLDRFFWMPSNAIRYRMPSPEINIIIAAEK